MVKQRMSETTETKKHWTARIVAERDAALQRVRELEREPVTNFYVMEGEHSGRQYTQDDIQRLVWKLEDYEKLEKERNDLLTELSDAKVANGQLLHQIHKDRNSQKQKYKLYQQAHMEEIVDLQRKLISVMFGEKPDLSGQNST
jgi:hypothetical protein